MEFENEDFSVIVPDYLINEQNEEQNIDYSSILEEMNTRLTNIEANTVNYTEALQGILTNMYFLDFVGFTFFIFVLLLLVIKFFKIFVKYIFISIKIYTIFSS